MRGPRTAIVLLCILPSVFCFAKNGAFKSTLHGDPDRGPERRADVPRGSCLQCHDQQADDYRSALQRKTDAGLFAPNDNNLCFVCHTAPSQSGAFPGNAVWSQSAHAQTKCDDCHDPHGVRDRDGVIDHMLAQREPQVCINCHDGSRGPDIRSQLTKSYVHGTLRRQALCSDCHNVHQVIKDPAPSSADPSTRLAGVTRVQVANGGAGVVPNYRLIAAGDPGDSREFEICFKCHSSYARQLLGQSDLARLTNPANASFHPIQATGRNARISPQAFVNGFGPDSIITCSDCHGSDDPTVRGPHGSSFRYLLKKSQDEICFDCHAHEVYADASSRPDTTRASRFDGHVLHVAIQKVPCFACHDAHGSARNGALIVTGRLPGINSYLQTPSGGNCTTSCHGLQSYTTSYPR